MTGLISQLADAIVALNNASPRLPPKAEIEDIVRSCLGAIFPAGMYGSHPGKQVLREVRVPPDGMFEVTPLPYKDVTATTLELMEQCKRATADITGIKNLPPPSAADLETMRLARKALAKTAFESPAIFDQAKVGDYLADGPCPGSTDGSHRWYAATSRIPNGAFRCACGARKPA